TRSRLGPSRGGLGPGAPRFVGRASDRRRRDPMATRSPLPDAGLPDRRRLQTTAVDRTRADRRVLAPRFGTAGPGVLLGLAIRVQRLVATVPQGARPTSRRSDPRARSLPHHEAT